MLCPNPMTVPSFLECSECTVDSRYVHIVQCIYMHIIGWVQYTLLLNSECLSKNVLFVDYGQNSQLSCFVN